jgi:DNA modification methylase
VATTLVNHGYIGLQDFRGMLIRAHQGVGWDYHGEVLIDKNPQAQAIRAHVKGLAFIQKSKDQSWLRPALCDYILLFRKRGDNAVPILTDVSNDEWIKLAHGAWYEIRENDTLNTLEAKEDDDERHIVPLQRKTIQNCIRLWSNRGEVVFDPFAGIGSTLYVAMQEGRRGLGCELKPRYFETAVKNCERALAMRKQGELFA